MKKLMTILASAATLCAVGVANGDALTTTGFEDYALGPLNTAQDDNGYTIDDGESFQKTWVDVGLLESAIVTNYAAGEEPRISNVNAGNKYLKLEDADLVTRYAQAGGDAVSLTAEGIYIDTLVKFTVSEDTEDQTTEEGDKLCIWVNVDSETGKTNLMVKAGYVSDETGEHFAPTSYVTDYSFNGDADKWHRLTVKAITGIDEYGVLDGFVIYVDNVVVGTSMPVMCEDFAAISPLVVENAFPSLISSDGAIQSIGFKGSGSVDELQFTAENPMPPPTPEPVTYELTITATGDATNTTYTATTNGTAVATGDLIEDGQAVVVVVTPNTGWEYASTPSDWSEGTAGAITRTFTVSGAALGITIPAPTAKSSGYPSGDGEHTFVIASDREAALTSALSSAGKTLADTVPGSSGLTYAQAYALGLWSENSAEVADLDATISVGADGKVTVTLANAPADGYVVTCNVYEKANLTADWPTEATATYAYGSETAFTPGSATAGFYKVEVVIRNALQD